MPDLDTALAEAVDDEYGLAATVLTRDMAHAQTA
jgi:acyl-CoA reductase-like NAD-dependent aldehyde dehydrogenase